MQTVFPDIYPESSSQFFKKIFKHTYNGIAVVSFKGRFTKVNDSVCELLGYSREELLTMTFKDITYKEDLKKSNRLFKKLVSGQIEELQLEKRYFHKNGSIIWTLVSASLYRDRSGEPTHIITQMIDITSFKKQSQKLNMMLNVAREQNERLNSFADIITHNLRSHTGNLSTLVDLLVEDCGDVTSTESYPLLRKALENLNDTVAHLTEVAKIKPADKSEIKPLDLRKYVKKAIYNISAIARNTNCEIINDVEKKVFVNGVPAYLDSIILNFLTNAIKYRDKTRDPKIHIRSEEQHKFIVLVVKDNGLGIDLEKYGDKLFQMYKTFHHNDDAIGVGLFITKNQIESMGGKVIVKSEVGVGSEFSIYLPKATTEIGQKVSKLTH